MTRSLSRARLLYPVSESSAFGIERLCPLRNKIALDSTQTLFLLVAERSMSCMSSSMGEVYAQYRDMDGFLYITYASQEMFGAAAVADTIP